MTAGGGCPRDTYGTLSAQPAPGFERLQAENRCIVPTLGRLMQRCRCGPSVKPQKGLVRDGSRLRIFIRPISKPLMEKKRRARINVSLEQLKSLLEKHYAHHIRKRKLEKADILELSVKYMKSLQLSVQGLWQVPSGAEYPSVFRGYRPGVSQFLRRGEEAGGGLRCPLAHERAGGSTMDSAGLSQETCVPRAPSAPIVWGPGPAAGDSRCSPPPLPDQSLGVLAPQPASHRCAESPGPGLNVWRPW
ncbi:Transcription factor HES-3 [Galemys pyrenaicus]|uniref:Transcription factor HES-3 n=1 Tax=Galemys pyrenaicus TaxID=202257 RepID=A0A8J5ZR78_GALPY|nr:Transcription factor HES-3 [Galemys pyrenaicus]